MSGANVEFCEASHENGGKMCSCTSNNLYDNIREMQKNSRFSAPKWPMLAAGSMTDHRLSDPRPPEGQLWAQMGPKMEQNLIIKIRFLAPSYTPLRIPYGFTRLRSLRQAVASSLVLQEGPLPDAVPHSGGHSGRAAGGGHGMP